VIVEQVLACVVIVESVVVGDGIEIAMVERTFGPDVGVQGAMMGEKYVPHPSAHIVGQAVYIILVGRMLGHSQGTWMGDSMIQSGCGQKAGVGVGHSGW
jgi:hypothetical protein